MKIDDNDVYHCLLILGEGCDDGILIDAEGANYARKSAFVPNARQIVNAPRYEYECITNLEKSLSDAADEIIFGGAVYDGEGPYRALTGEFAETHRFDEIYTPLLVAMLNERGQKDAFECETLGDEIFVHKLKPAQSALPFEPERMKQLLDSAMNWIGEKSSGSNLYDTLKNTFGMTDDEIAAAGFDSLEKYAEEQDKDDSMKME